MENLHTRVLASIGKGNGYSPLYRYSFLVLILALLYWVIKIQIDAPKSVPVSPGGFVVVSILLVNHIAYAFPWSYQTRVNLRILAIGWAVVGIVFLCSELALKSS
jgi:hypothetical protein